MEMFENVGSVLMNIGRTAFFGFCVSFPLEIISVWNRVKAPSKKAVFSADIAYCISIAFVFFMLLLEFSDGSLRIVWFISVALGGLVYKYTLGKPVSKLIRFVFCAFDRFVGFFKKTVFHPVRLFLKKILRISLKPLQFLLKYIRIIGYDIKIKKVRKRIAGRKRKWLRKQNKTLRRKTDC